MPEALVSPTRCSAKQCTTEPGPTLCGPNFWVPGLQRIIPLALHAAQRTGHDVPYHRDLAARFARGFANSLPLFEQRAQGMPGARCTRGLVCQKLRIWRTRAYRAAEAIRHPLRNGFTAYFVLSPVSGLFATVIPEKLASQELSASGAAPGPHDFTVRRCPFVCAQKARLNKSVHRISSQRSVTTADAPPRG
jgi:hypothetical protein